MKPIHAYRQNLCPHLLLIISLFVLPFVFGMKAFAYQEGDQYKIAYLLKEIAASDLTFVRNGKNYTGEEASAHLKIKLDFAGNRIRTVDDFINDIASRSTVTNTPYYVR